MTTKSTVQTLTVLGLSLEGVETYLTCLQLGKAKASEIAKKSSLTRTAIYRHLDELIAKGLIHYDIKNGKRYYYGANPEVITQLLKQQVQGVESLLPKLIDLFAGSHPESPKFRFYNEADGIKIVLEEVLNNQERSYRVMGSIYDAEFLLSVTEDYLIDWTKRRIAQGVHHLSLQPHSAKGKPANPLISRSSPELLREIRYAPEAIQLPIIIYLFDEKIAFVNGRLGRQFAAILESKDVFQAVGSIFDFIWAQAGKPE